jgi:mercuric ion transport protein
MRVQFLHFRGCPNIDSARAALQEALAAQQVEATVEEIDVEDPASPEWSRAWGSPTILIDGQDLLGQSPSTGATCRLYVGGAPSVEVISARLAAARVPARASSRGRVLLPLLSAMAVALASSACCVLPAVLAVLGVSGAGVAARFGSLRAPFLAATLIALGLGFWFAYRPQRDDCGCEAPRTRRAARIGLWLTTLVAAALAVYPMLGSSRAVEGSQLAPAQATLRLRVIGMDCKECTGAIAKRLKKIPGVVAASVDYESGTATVRHDGRLGIPNDAVKAVEDAGFRAEAL